MHVRVLSSVNQERLCVSKIMNSEIINDGLLLVSKVDVPVLASSIGLVAFSKPSH